MRLQGKMGQKTGFKEVLRAQEKYIVRTKAPQDSHNNSVWNDLKRTKGSMCGMDQKANLDRPSFFDILQIKLLKQGTVFQEV